MCNEIKFDSMLQMDRVLFCELVSAWIQKHAFMEPKRGQIDKNEPGSAFVGWSQGSKNKFRGKRGKHGVCRNFNGDGCHGFFPASD